MLPERSGDDVPLFPCCPPYPEAFAGGDLTLNALLTGEDWAKSMVNMFVAWANFVVLGSPKCLEGWHEPRVGYRSVADIKQFADRLLGEVVSFCSPELIGESLRCEGKRLQVEEVLDLLSCTVSSYERVAGKADFPGTTALPVVADRVAIPAEAGQVDPLQWLPEEQAAVVSHLPEIMLPAEEWGDRLTPCHRVPPAEEADLVRKLLKAQMIELVPEHLLPRSTDGEPLVGGLFCVAKNATEATETDIDMQKTKTAEKAYEVWVLLCRIIKIGGCAKNILQRVVGYTSFILQYRRELFSLQHNIYCFMKKMPEQGYVNLPPFVIDELRSYALHLPFCITDMRRYVSETLFATDATPTSGGAVRAQAPRVLVDELWRLSEHRGSPERLDRDVDFFEQQVPKAPSKFVSMVSECLPWEVTAAYEFRQTSHINLQEARALKRELVRLAGKLNSYGMIQLCLNDSRVVVGAVAKGRSSSFKLNGILRSLVPFLILGGVSFAMLWVETHSNRADHPSRRELLPAPRVPPPWLGAFGLKAVVLQKPGLEIFTVSESLTLKAHERVGWKMLPAITVRDAWNAMDCTWDNTIANRAISFLWTAEQPEGDEADPKVAVGNLLWRQALLLAWQAHLVGDHAFIVVVILRDVEEAGLVRWLRWWVADLKPRDAVFTLSRRLWSDRMSESAELLHLQSCRFTPSSFRAGGGGDLAADISEHADATASDLKASATTPEAAAHTMVKALHAAATQLGPVEVAPGLPASAVLNDQNARSAASRWRAGSEIRRMTAAMARFAESLRSIRPSWIAPASTPEEVSSVPVAPLPLRVTARTAPPPTLQRTLTSLAGLCAWQVLRWKWTFGALLLLLLWPRLVGLMVAFLMRLIARAFYYVLGRMLKEVLLELRLGIVQLLTVVSEVELQLVEQLEGLLGISLETAHTPAYLTDHTMPASSSAGHATGPTQHQQGGNSLPARPLEIVQVVLLALLCRRAPGVGGVGNAGGQARP
ncbi:unnamed protein product [Symbiodinium microadriaticum]|nr:unnamed protein product [Symbiodinium microadriaticum]CAE7906249.1 unnamed protein product [Symbiodinium sp. KB8]